MSHIICPNCKHQTDGNESFCSSCGTKLEQIPKDPFIRMFGGLSSSEKIGVGIKLAALIVPALILGENDFIFSFIFLWSALGRLALTFEKSFFSQLFPWFIDICMVLFMGVMFYKSSMEISKLDYCCVTCVYIVVFILPLDITCQFGSFIRGSFFKRKDKLQNATEDNEKNNETGINTESDTNK